MPAKKIKFIAGFAVIIASLLVLVVSSSKQMAMYYFTVTELEAREIEFLDKRIKLAGKVVPGSIQQIDGNRTVEFLIWEPIEKDVFSDKRAVRYSGIVPDTFRDESDVVLEGKTDANGVFVAETLLAKCPSKYESKSYDDIKASHDLK
ncbi:MAG: cytochrome c maturation protein CcmE [bacterium]|jgi:cytochrome c-type biogenesis protein CcmE|nr:cytochrome c maturation protein CcmE [bacterium]